MQTDGLFLKENSVTEDILGKVRKLAEIAGRRGQGLVCVVTVPGKRFAASP